MNAQTLSIRRATRADVPLVLSFVNDLAEVREQARSHSPVGPTANLLRPEGLDPP